MYFFKTLITVVIFTITINVSAQIAVNNNGTAADESAMLDVKSTTRGMLIPRMSTSDMNNIDNPVGGLTIFNTTTNTFYYYTGSLWSPINANDGDWAISGDNMYSSISGNVGIGTTSPNKKLSIVNGNIQIDNTTNNSKTGIIYKGNEPFIHNFNYGSIAGITTSGHNTFVGINSGNLTMGNIALVEEQASFNTAVGDSSFFSNSNGYNNSALGYLALTSNIDGRNNTSVGSHSMSSNTTGNDNTVQGYQSLNSNIVGEGNSAFGYRALFNALGNNNSGFGYNALSNCTGSYNIGIGYQAGYGITMGYNNIAIGNGTLSSNIDRSYNIAIGYYSLNNNGIGATGSTEGNYNTSIGSSALSFNTIGAENTAIGFESLQANTTAYANTATGYYTLRANTTGDINSAFGSEALTTNTTGRANTAIGCFSLHSNTTGGYNTSCGDWSLESNTEGGSNVAFGDNALSANTTAHSNSAFGSSSLRENTTGENNCAIGRSTLYHNTTGSSNTAIGKSALNNSLTGFGNTGVGYYSTYDNSNGNYNTAIGYYAGKNITGGDQNIAIGYKAYVPISTASHQLNIGNLIYGTQLDGSELVISSGKIGIGTTAPNETLEVANKDHGHGRMAVSDGNGSERYVLLFQSPASTYANGRIESYKYGTTQLGCVLEINTVGDAKTIFGGDIVTETHKGKSIGQDGLAWDNVYCDDLIEQGTAAFDDRVVTDEIINYPPIAKTKGDFDYQTDNGLAELNPNSLPKDLREGNGVLTGEMASYNYKANYEQQVLINSLIKEIKELRVEIEKLKN